MDLICQYCGKEFESEGIRDANFCSDACRYTWHNTERRIKRLEKAILKRIDDLREIINGDSSLRGKALSSVDSIIAELDTMPSRKYECRECHQIAFSKPSQGEKCSYCMKVDTYRPIISQFKA